ncbi:MAG: nucleotidyltransferase family protein [Planctomycetota bacterium]
MSREPEWAMNESDAFFRDAGKVHETLREITRRLTELGIPHAVVGGMALYRHGFRRSTEDVDLLVTPESLKRIHAELEGRGYLPPFARSKNLRDTQTGVKIEFLKTGDFPGDGKPKPFAFPDPADVVEVRDGIPVVRLTTLIELKIASGISSPDRLKDLADVQELIKILSLPAGFVSQLHPFVRDTFNQLWTETQPSLKRFLRLWPCPLETSAPIALVELAKLLPVDAPVLASMQESGVQIDTQRDRLADGVWLVTTDPAVAAKYDMHEESEFKD